MGEMNKQQHETNGVEDDSSRKNGQRKMSLELEEDEHESEKERNLARAALSISELCGSCGGILSPRPSANSN